MGMYDEIKCQYELPDKVVQNEIFQTKSLDSLQESYRISEDGKLFKVQRVMEWKEDSDHPLGGCLKTLSSWEDQVTHHGYINMYTSVDKKWYEYKIKFTDGEIVDIAIVHEEE